MSEGEATNSSFATPVQDNENPAMNLFTNRNGDQLNIHVQVSDNIGVEKVGFYYAADGGADVSVGADPFKVINSGRNQLVFGTFVELYFGTHGAEYLELRRVFLVVCRSVAGTCVEYYQYFIIFAFQAENRKSVV